MSDAQMLMFMAREGLEVLMLLMTHGMIPLLYANAKVLSLTLSFTLITTVYPFHNTALCLWDSNKWSTCLDTLMVRRGNITHDILALDDKIQGFTANATRDFRSAAANVTHSAMERAKTRLGRMFNATALNTSFLVHQK